MNDIRNLTLAAFPYSQTERQTMQELHKRQDEVDGAIKRMKREGIDKISLSELAELANKLFAAKEEITKAEIGVVSQWLGGYFTLKQALPEYQYK